MQDFSEVLETYERHVSRPYVAFLRRFGLDIEIVSARGACLYDRSGRRIIDCVAGYGNLNIGHNHARVIEAVVGELRSPRPFGWPFVSTLQARLAERLARVTPGDLECSLLVNSGSEAVESAIKLVRLATGKPHFVSMRGAWHGFTLGALSVSEPTMRRDFTPLLRDVTLTTFGDIAAVAEAITESTGAVLVEPIQSENGAVEPPAGFLAELEVLCRKRGALLIFDEIKTGIGKTGRLFACERDGVVPDILLVGKSLGGGAVPLGAMVARRQLWKRLGLSFPMSSSSAAGNGPACAAALATLDVVESELLCERAEATGDRIAVALTDLSREFSRLLLGVSGRGLLIGLRTTGAAIAASIVARAVRDGVLAMPAFLDRSTILVEPPLCIEDEEVTTVIATLRNAVERVAREEP